MPRLRSAIKALHARKDKAYGAAWKRRGERISIVPNIARKVDRLIAFAVERSELLDEPILDTVIDLHVYCIKYLLFLVDQDVALIGRLPLAEPIWPLSDREENFNQFVDTTGYEEPESKSLNDLVAATSDLFERLWPAVEANASCDQRFAVADALFNMSARLVARVRLDQPGAIEKFSQDELGMMSRET